MDAASERERQAEQSPAPPPLGGSTEVAPNVPRTAAEELLFAKAVPTMRGYIEVEGAKKKKGRGPRKTHWACFRGPILALYKTDSDAKARAFITLTADTVVTPLGGEGSAAAAAAAGSAGEGKGGAEGEEGEEGKSAAQDVNDLAIRLTGCLGDSNTVVVVPLTSRDRISWLVALTGVVEVLRGDYSVPTVPPAPAAPQTTGVTHESATINWGAPAVRRLEEAVTGYAVECRKDETGEFRMEGQVGVQNATTVVKLASLSRYEWRIAAVNTYGCGPFSEPSATVTVLGKPSFPPDAPKSVPESRTTTPSSSTMCVTWTPHELGPHDAPITAYRLCVERVYPERWPGGKPHSFRDQPRRSVAEREFGGILGEEKKCPQGHDLTLHTTEGDRGTCDGCSRSLDHGTKVVDCIECDFFLCNRCDSRVDAASGGGGTDSTGTGVDGAKGGANGRRRSVPKVEFGSKFCSKCGTGLTPDVKFCSGCGQTTPAAAAAAVAAAEASEAKENGGGEEDDDVFFLDVPAVNAPDGGGGASMSHVVNNLRPETLYRYNVAAVNPAGVGPKSSWSSPLPTLGYVGHVQVDPSRSK